MDSNIENISLKIATEIALKKEVTELFIKTTEEHKGTPAYMLKHFLLILKGFKEKPDKINFFTLKKLIDREVTELFTEEYREKFYEGFDLLENGIDFFCSYTTRGLPATNNDFKDAINNQYNSGDKVLPDWGTTNYMAKMIVRFFNDNNFNGFFDQENLVSGDLIKDNVYKYCKSASVFVQFLEQTSFRDERAQTNWCLQEYETYRDVPHRNKRYIFYKDPCLVPPKKGDHRILEWYKFANTTDGVASKTIAINMTNREIRSIVNKDADIVFEESERVFDQFLENID